MCIDKSTVQPTSVLTKASVWYEIRVLWEDINHVKSLAMAMAFSRPQTLTSNIFAASWPTRA